MGCGYLLVLVCYNCFMIDSPVVGLFSISILSILVANLLNV
jgi:hypothetical protein